MQETAQFIKYEKSSVAMDISSKILAAALFLAVIVSAVLGFVLYDETYFNIYFYITIAAAIVYVFVPLPIGIVAQKRKHVLELYRSYATVLSRNPRNAVTEIRESLGTDEAHIVDNFIKLNEKGFFESIFIDKEQLIVNSGNIDMDSREYTCPVCGGTSSVAEGGADVCGFCGAIQEKETD
ncbi:MAG: hypothetical protein J1F36_04485 [Clostridiales bacterium]|nr:hypothetical protein [Clostridiales bacterium]